MSRCSQTHLRQQLPAFGLLQGALQVGGVGGGERSRCTVGAESGTEQQSSLCNIRLFTHLIAGVILNRAQEARSHLESKFVRRPQPLTPLVRRPQRDCGLRADAAEPTGA